METLLANLSAGKVRREKMNGRDYLVAPMTLIVPGVLNGSQGALYYPQEEVERDPHVWNGMPIVVYHPMSANGSHISARDPEVLNRQGIGVVLKSHASGKLRAEGWFDIESTKRVDDTLAHNIRILPRLLRNEAIELSTGLFTENEFIKGISPQGRAYDAIARNYRPDHLAVLPDQVGACSRNDGCGVMVNQAADESLWSFLTSNEGTERDEDGQFQRSDAAVSVAGKKKKKAKKLDAVESDSADAKKAIAEFASRVSKTRNANPEGCNQYSESSCGSGEEDVFGKKSDSPKHKNAMEGTEDWKRQGKGIETKREKNERQAKDPLDDVKTIAKAVIPTVKIAGKIAGAVLKGTQAVVGGVLSMGADDSLSSGSIPQKFMPTGKRHSGDDLRGDLGLKRLDEADPRQKPTRNARWVSLLLNAKDDDADGKWITIKGAKVFVSDGGEILKGPAGLMGGGKKGGEPKGKKEQPWTKGLFDLPKKSKPKEDPYGLMGKKKAKFAPDKPVKSNGKKQPGLTPEEGKKVAQAHSKKSWAQKLKSFFTGSGIVDNWCNQHGGTTCKEGSAGAKAQATKDEDGLGKSMKASAMLKAAVASKGATKAAAAKSVAKVAAKQAAAKLKKKEMIAKTTAAKSSKLTKAETKERDRLQAKWKKFQDKPLVNR